ncbi:MazG nucleotide pyrophosphohydrolase domain-containing protein [Fodinicurvata sediminis]|uniref:MazG nucleotide pyrophosphohydrolase domain-containing protein n=1 Tax=Fodinicurvata sediminis TaxID=1121832 RepID=UPI0003B568B6|nr:MazG nucleotide pyrophosphohydrolase domain-containing protein [Fodinicurvata sediminis]
MTGREKFISPEPAPEGLERELLTILAEECCEIGQRVTKALRFGVREIQPGQSLTNDERIAEEVGDLLAVLVRLQEMGLLSNETITDSFESKQKKLGRYLQNSGEEAVR